MAESVHVSRGGLCGRIHSILHPSETDARLLADNDCAPADREDDFYDYSRVVVQKPWGYEYLIFQNEGVAVWILYIKAGFQTSMHCHPGKRTSLVVLSGQAVCTVQGEDIPRAAAEGLLIGRGVFHRTRAVSDDGIYVMELETPVNKRDLVRYLDDYGREHSAYEGEEHFSLNTSNYNYVSLIESAAYYDRKKRFGDCSIELVRFATEQEFCRAHSASDWDVLAILRGTIVRAGGEPLAQAGDALSRDDLSADDLGLQTALDAIVIRRVDTSTRLSEYVIASLKSHGVKHVFFVAEAVIAHLTDALGRETDMTPVAMRTDSGATLAADGFAKLTGEAAVVFVASGSSAISALPGVAGAYIDSAPLLLISGQSRPRELGTPGGNRLRQLANKELDIVGTVKRLTCFAKTLEDPNAIRRDLDAAFSAMRALRPGPAWLDIPSDVLGMNIDERELLPLARAAKRPPASLSAQTRSRISEMIAGSHRPVLLAGHGVRLSRAADSLIRAAEKHRIPILTSRRGIDLVAQDSPLFFGRPGTYGQRSANFIVQNCDLLISVGCRLSFPMIGRNYRAFARAASKIVVDIDPEELRKPTIRPDLAVESPASAFLEAMLEMDQSALPAARSEWLGQCAAWRETFPPESEGYEDSASGVNPYLFVASLSELLPEDAILSVDGGSSLDYVMQRLKVKRATRVISAPGLEQQGFALPAAIGACVAANGKRVFALCERRGLELSAAELQTLSANRLPVAILLLNSVGDVGTQRVQTDYFGKRFVGTTTQATPTHLNARALGELYDLPAHAVRRLSELSAVLEGVLAARGPVLVDVQLPEQFELKPRMTFSVTADGRWISPPLEDMFPFLPREVLRANMLIPLAAESDGTAALHED